MQSKNSYDYQRVKFWARKRQELDPEEFQKLVELRKPEEKILKMATEIIPYEKPC